ncbi:heavy-metal-associated domain-containing protein [Consotaella salsifontis]|uniref:Cu2+-exporting ATPase/Cd2+/Zn2+-exporting ATPase/copper chaperone/Cu+-exporting ATPase n=1 Tax=Consotaella salsifontis TaxID=1365950 RepID=A0A1T4SXF8_9HYPH|nr:heavy metal-associated domain-containing protein [Consotaella salsifontis]SKA32839.1 Cu2+-exporting ATPase/Cd2+/Zn2+-exporting ATPase/copper chaperone/Cu+-exporting ATPase [Consotaella salsifontis]
MDQELTATTLSVVGMDCTGCARKIDGALRALEGVRDVSLHYPDTTLGVLHDPRVTESDIRTKVESLGFDVGAAPAL